MYTIIELAEAYNLNKMYQETLDFISCYYYKWAGEIPLEYIILDALFGMNKSEADFKWINKPIVLRRDNICDFAFEAFRNKRRFVTRRDIFTELEIHFYTLVTYEEFEFLIQADKRFKFKVEDEIKVKVKTKKELTQIYKALEATQ